MKEYLKGYLDNNYKLLKITLMCFFIGIGVGIAIYFFLDDGIKNEFITSLKNTLELSKKSNFEDINIIRNGVISNGLLLFFIYFCSITLFAPLFICFIDFFKGFAIGLYIPIVFVVFNSTNPFLALLFLSIIPNLLFIPAFIFSATNAINFHYCLFDKEKSGYVVTIFKEIALILIAYSIIILSVVLEQILTSNIINMYIGV